MHTCYLVIPYLCAVLQSDLMLVLHFAAQGRTLLCSEQNIQGLLCRIWRWLSRRQSCCFIPAQTPVQLKAAVLVNNSVLSAGHDHSARSPATAGRLPYI